MQIFINYENGTLSANTFRIPGGYDNGDILGFIGDIASGHAASCYSGCLQDATDVLCDGEALASLCDKHGDSEVQNIVETVHSFISQAASH